MFCIFLYLVSRYSPLPSLPLLPPLSSSLSLLLSLLPSQPLSLHFFVYVPISLFPATGIFVYPGLSRPVYVSLFLTQTHAHTPLQKALPIFSMKLILTILIKHLRTSYDIRKATCTRTADKREIYANPFLWHKSNKFPSQNTQLVNYTNSSIKQ